MSAMQVRRTGPETGLLHGDGAMYLADTLRELAAFRRLMSAGTFGGNAADDMLAIGLDPVEDRPGSVAAMTAVRLQAAGWALSFEDVRTGPAAQHRVEVLLEYGGPTSSLQVYRNGWIELTRSYGSESETVLLPDRRAGADARSAIAYVRAAFDVIGGF